MKEKTILTNQEKPKVDTKGPDDNYIKTLEIPDYLITQLSGNLGDEVSVEGSRDEWESEGGDVPDTLTPSDKSCKGILTAVNRDGVHIFIEKNDVRILPFYEEAFKKGYYKHITQLRSITIGTGRRDILKETLGKTPSDIVRELMVV